MRERSERGLPSLSRTITSTFTRLVVVDRVKISLGLIRSGFFSVSGGAGLVSLGARTVGPTSGLGPVDGCWSPFDWAYQSEAELVNSSRPANNRIACREQRLFIAHHPRSARTIQSYDAIHCPLGQPKRDRGSPKSAQPRETAVRREPRQDSNGWKWQQECSVRGVACQGSRLFAARYPSTIAESVPTGHNHGESCQGRN